MTSFPRKVRGVHELRGFCPRLQGYYYYCTTIWSSVIVIRHIANYLIHERILYIYRSCIHFSIRTDGQLRFTDGQLVYHRYRPYRWTRFLEATLCPCNNANYLIHERILYIYRSCIHFSIRTDGQLRFTDGQLVYHRYRPYR